MARQAARRSHVTFGKMFCEQNRTFGLNEKLEKRTNTYKLLRLCKSNAEQ